MRAAPPTRSSRSVSPSTQRRPSSIGRSEPASPLSLPRHEMTRGERRDQAAEKCAPGHDAGDLDALPAAAGVVTDGAKAVQRWHAEGRGEAAVRAAARGHLEDRRAELGADIFGEAEQSDCAGSPWKCRTTDAALER